MAQVGFAGLGTMGGPMAGHLLKQQGEVMVWNRTASKADDLVDRGATRAESLAQMGESCDTIFLCVGRTEDVQECIRQLAETARPGTLIVDHSTINPAATAEIHQELTARSLRFLDAPITGGSMGAEAGTLTIFCGGSQEDFDSAIPLMDAYARRAELVGGPGRGQMMKMANQIAVAGTILGMAECLAFAEKAGLDPAQAREMIGGGAGGSWAMENYGPKALEGDWTPGFSIKHQRKDFGYAGEAAEEIDAKIPMTELCDRLLAEIDDPEKATAALIEAYR